MGNEYSSRHSSADKYFNAISEIIGENQITCDVELLAQTLASKFSSKVYRFDTMYSITIANLIKRSVIVIYNSRVVLTGKLPILGFLSRKSQS